MAKYKNYDYSQGKFIPINFDKQILPGTFEHTLHYIIDNNLIDEMYEYAMSTPDDYEEILVHTVEVTFSP